LDERLHRGPLPRAEEQRLARRGAALCPGFTYSEFHDRLGFDRTKIPKFLWLKADDVVAQSLRGLERRRLFVVTGWQYRLAVLLIKVLPAPLVRAVNTRRQRRFNRI
jgi:short-subunit dehydrogenase